MTRLCVVDVCQIHTADCPRDGCDCPPALAALGLAVCGHHADQPRAQLRELPELWAILGAKPSSSSAGGGNGGIPLPISDRARDARSAMKAMLVTWAKVLQEDRGITLPDEQVIAARTRLEIFRHQSDATMHLDAWRNRDHIRRHADPSQHLAIRDNALAQAGLMLDARETGSDIIEALREHIDRHLSWLLAGEHADQLVHDVQAVHDTARRTAYPARAAIRILCGCGERVPISTEQGAIIACPGCKEWGTLAWWRDRETPNLDGPVTLRDLPDVMFAAYGLVLTHKQLRNWADRGIISRYDYVRVPARYDPQAVAVVATARLGRRTA